MLITAILVQTVAREVGLKKTCSTTIYTFEVITRSMRLGLYSRPFCLDFYFLLHPLRQKPLWGSLENSPHVIVDGAVVGGQALVLVTVYHLRFRRDATDRFVACARKKKSFRSFYLILQVFD